MFGGKYVVCVNLFFLRAPLMALSVHSHLFQVCLPLLETPDAKGYPP